MVGTESIPHWFRRAVSLLRSETPIPYRRRDAVTARAREIGEQRRIAKRLEARDTMLRARRGPKALEEIVLSWEEQNARKALAAAKRRRR